jgi:hypothetical protein
MSTTLPARIRYLILRGPSFRTPDEARELEAWNTVPPKPSADSEQQRAAEFAFMLGRSV